MKRLKVFAPILITVALVASAFAAALPVAAAEIAMSKDTFQHPDEPVHPDDVYLVGQEVHYEMDITNTNDELPMTIQITDRDPSGETWYYIEGTDSFELAGPASDVTLEPLEVWEHDFHHVIQPGDLYEHPMLPGTFVFTNTLLADGLQGVDIVDVDVGKTARVVQPDISVTKEADTEVSKAGDEINYTISIENTGDWPLVDVTVVDDVLGDLSALFVDSLAPGETDTQIIPYAVPDPEPADPLVNEVTASGQAEGFDADVVADIGPVVTDTATDSVDLVHPDIAIEKTADVEFSKAGDTVNYAIEVSNTGDVELIDVEVTDSLAAESPWVIGSILPGESEVIDFAYVVQEGDPDPLVNTATATGYLDGLPNVIGPVEDSVSVDLVHPDIAITKECDPDSGGVGDVITYTITIENTGDVDLENVTVMDSLMGDLSASFVDYLAVGESDVQMFDRAIEEGDPDPLVNTAEVNATVIVLGNPVSDTDSCEVDIEEDFEGCTPGFWKNNADKWDAVAWMPTGYSPDDSFSSVFGAVIEVRAGGRNTINDPTLLEALEATGGGINALARAATAALLNAAHPEINYAMTEAEIIAAVQTAIADGDAAIKMLAEELDMYNNAGCSIDMHGNVE